MGEVPPAPQARSRRLSQQLVDVAFEAVRAACIGGDARVRGEELLVRLRLGCVLGDRPAARRGGPREQLGAGACVHNSCSHTCLLPLSCRPEGGSGAARAAVEDDAPAVGMGGVRVCCHGQHDEACEHRRQYCSEESSRDAVWTQPVAAPGLSATACVIRPIRFIEHLRTLTPYTALSHSRQARTGTCWYLLGTSECCASERGNPPARGVLFESFVGWREISFSCLVGSAGESCMEQSPKTIKAFSRSYVGERSECVWS